ncbi:fasciclin domain-containing protein [Puteibacter caeruleilacunae]|nr:fasciclin domain-containing protein [Puteibacter caeruleilacunae]
MKRSISYRRVIVLSTLFTWIVASMFFNSCKQDNFSEQSWDDDRLQLMLDYFEDRDDMQKTIEVIKRAGYYGTLNSYGPYTFFAPNNDAWDAYLQKHSYGSIDDIPEDLCKSIVEYHIIPKKKLAESLESGPLPAQDTTINGDRLQVDLSKGVNNITINFQSTFDEYNIEVWNGVVHVVDGVIEPPVNNVGEWLRANNDFSMFADLCEEVGIMDTISTKRIKQAEKFVNKEFTVFALDNSVLEEYADVIEEMRQYDLNYEKNLEIDPDYAIYNYPEKLKRWVAMHFSTGLEYVADMRTTLKPTIAWVPYDDQVQKLKVKVDGEDVLINKEGAELDKVNSNVICKNGIIHRVSENFGILPRPPKKRVFAAFPSNDHWFSTNDGVVKDRKYYGWERFYIDDDGDGGGQNFVAKEAGQSVECYIPDVIAGKYQLVVAYKSDGNGGFATMEVEGQLLGPNTPGSTVSPGYFDENGGFDWRKGYKEAGIWRVDTKGENNLCSYYPMYCSSTNLGEFVVEESGTIHLKSTATTLGKKSQWWIFAFSLEPVLD